MTAKVSPTSSGETRKLCMQYLMESSLSFAEHITKGSNPGGITILQHVLPFNVTILEGIGQDGDEDVDG